MKAHIITLADDNSQSYTNNCIESINKTESMLDVELFDATTHKNLQSLTGVT
jgi:hypothetical protein